jgi:prevent-host-death family protein
MYKVGMQELRKRFSELVHRAGGGEMIGITKSGKFVAILQAAIPR